MSFEMAVRAKEPSAAQRVFATYELVEDILMDCTMCELFVLQRVSTTVCYVIGRSKTFQRRLWLIPHSDSLLDPKAAKVKAETGDGHICLAPDGTVVKVNPILDKLWPRFMNEKTELFNDWNKLFIGRCPTNIEEEKNLDIDIPLRLNLHITLASRIDQSPSMKPKSMLPMRKTSWKGGSWEKMFLTQPPVPDMTYITGYMSGCDTYRRAHVQGTSSQGRLSNRKGITLGALNAWERRLAKVALPQGIQLKYIQLTLAEVEEALQSVPLQPLPQNILPPHPNVWTIYTPHYQNPVILNAPPMPGAGINVVGWQNLPLPANVIGFQNPPPPGFGNNPVGFHFPGTSNNPVGNQNLPAPPPHAGPTIPPAAGPPVSDPPVAGRPATPVAGRPATPVAPPRPCRPRPKLLVFSPSNSHRAPPATPVSGPSVHPSTPTPSQRPASSHTQNTLPDSWWDQYSMEESGDAESDYGDVYLTDGGNERWGYHDQTPLHLPDY